MASEQVKGLKDLIRSMTWDKCPYCLGSSRDLHRNSCPVAAALAAEEPAGAGLRPEAVRAFEQALDEHVRSGICHADVLLEIAKPAFTDEALLRDLPADTTEEQAIQRAIERNSWA